MKMWQNIRATLSTDIAKNSAKLLSASIIVQIIGLLVYPILTRLYSPDDFGLINLFLSFCGVLSLFATAEFQYSIVLPKDDALAKACFHLGLISTIFFTILLICSIPFSVQISRIFKVSELSTWYWAVPIFVFLTAIWTLLNYWYTRKKQFGAISSYQITQSITNASAKLGFGFGGLVSGGLILSAIAAPIVALSLSIARNCKSTIRELFSFDRNNCSLVAKQYANFPKYSLPRAIVNNLSGNLPILLLTPFFGLTEIGLFGMALTLAFRPINMISSSLYQVFYQKTTEQVQNRQSIKSFFSSFVKSVSIIVIPCFILLYFFLPTVIEFILGAGWRETGAYIQIMLVWLLMSALLAPISYISDVFQKQKIALLFELLLFVSRILGLVIGIYTTNFVYAIMGYSFATAIVLLAELLWYRRLIRHYETEISI